MTVLVKRQFDQVQRKKNKKKKKKQQQKKKKKKKKKKQRSSARDIIFYCMSILKFSVLGASDSDENIPI